MKAKVAVLPIWKIVISDKLYYFVLGTNKKLVIENIKTNGELLYDGKEVTIHQVNPENSHKILLQLDLEDEDEYTTLYEEAQYYSEHPLECEFFLASSFDVVADFNLQHVTNPT